MAVNKRKIQRIIDEVIVPVTEQTVSPTITHTSEVESQEMTDARKPQVSETVIVQSQADVPHGTPFLNIYGQIEQAGSEAPLHNLLEVAAELLNGYNPGWTYHMRKLKIVNVFFLVGLVKNLVNSSLWRVYEQS